MNQNDLLNQPTDKVIQKNQIILRSFILSVFVCMILVISLCVQCSRSSDKDAKIKQLENSNNSLSDNLLEPR